MEIKWMAIAFTVLFGGAMMALGITEYQKGQCKIAYVQSNKTAEEIKNICGVNK
jgi:hypothetical protein